MCILTIDWRLKCFFTNCALCRTNLVRFISLRKKWKNRVLKMNRFQVRNCFVFDWTCWSTYIEHCTLFSWLQKGQVNWVGTVRSNFFFGFGAFLAFFLFPILDVFLSHQQRQSRTKIVATNNQLGFVERNWKSFVVANRHGEILRKSLHLQFWKSRWAQTKQTMKPLGSILHQSTWHKSHLPWLRLFSCKGCWRRRERSVTLNYIRFQTQTYIGGRTQTKG